jgi:ribosomal-protein-alanine N-acetyltransferase
MFDASPSIHAARPPEIAATSRVSLQSRESVALRAGARDDLRALEALECRAFAHDRISRRSFARLLYSPSASLIVADYDGALCGYALVLFRPQSTLARLYSIAVNPEFAGRQLGSILLRAAEVSASGRSSTGMRLEVRESNVAANNLYRKSGYCPVARLPAYYADGSDALRLEKPLNGTPALADSAAPL